MFEDNKKYFNHGLYLFWALFLLILNFLIFNFSNDLFSNFNLSEIIIENENQKPDEIISETEKDSSSAIISEDSTLYSWKWSDFENNSHQLFFKLKNNDIKQADQNRKNIKKGIPDVYSKLYEQDKTKISGLIEKMKQEIKKRKLSYLAAINYVCSSIQYIPYTLILGDEGKCPCKLPFGNFSAYCRVQKDGRGCCSNVLPSGVYSPLEFVFLKTGDCDTRALLAYTILKQMGFDAAVMISNNESHSVLGIHLPNSNNFPYGINLQGKKYALWELTSYDWRLGMDVEGDDWITALE